MKGTLKLLGILAVLIAIYFIVQLTRDKGRSRSLRSELVQIDTAAVTRLLVGIGNEQLVMEKEEGMWKVTLESGKKAPASPSAVHHTLSSLVGIKPGRLVSRDKNKWNAYQVDSTGTRVQVFQASKKTLDLVVGRFNMEAQRQFSTYVRLYEDTEVYSAPDFMGASLSASHTTYRNQQLARVTRDSLYQVAFNYPDSSFTLSKTDGKWMLGSASADSAGTAKYLQGITYLSSRLFADDFSPTGSPAISVTLLAHGISPVKLEGYLTDTVLHIRSDANPETFFNDPALKEKIFKGQAYFVKK